MRFLHRGPCIIRPDRSGFDVCRYCKSHLQVTNETMVAKWRSLSLGFSVRNCSNRCGVRVGAVGRRLRVQQRAGAGVQLKTGYGITEEIRSVEVLVQGRVDSD